MPPVYSVVSDVTMANIASRLDQKVERMWHAWAALEKSTTLGDNQSCLAYDHILWCYRPLIGNEALSLISFAIKSIAELRSLCLDNNISSVIYRKEVPCGRLPLDMPTVDFIRESEKEIMAMPK